MPSSSLTDRRIRIKQNADAVGMAHATRDEQREVVLNVRQRLRMRTEQELQDNAVPV